MAQNEVCQLLLENFISKVLINICLQLFMDWSREGISKYMDNTFPLPVTHIYMFLLCRIYKMLNCKYTTNTQLCKYVLLCL